MPESGRAGEAVTRLWRNEPQEVKGHKVFVFEKAGSPWIEMVNDEPGQLVRMTLQLLPDEARGIARALIDAADATDDEIGSLLTKPDVTERDWKYTWHAFIDSGELCLQGQTYRPRCARCGVADDRAIHSRGYARHGGYEWIDEDGHEVDP